MAPASCLPRKRAEKIASLGRSVRDRLLTAPRRKEIAASNKLTLQIMHGSHAKTEHENQPAINDLRLANSL
jgi:hypothetical protein